MEKLALKTINCEKIKLSVLTKLLLDFVNLLSQQVIVLGSRVCHFEHITFDFSRVRDQVVHTLVEHRVRIGDRIDCLYAVKNENSHRLRKNK